MWLSGPYRRSGYLKKKNSCPLPEFEPSIVLLVAWTQNQLLSKKYLNLERVINSSAFWKDTGYYDRCND